MVAKVRKGIFMELIDEPVITLGVAVFRDVVSQKVCRVFVDVNSTHESLAKQYGSLEGAVGKTMYLGVDDRHILDGWVPESEAGQDVIQGYMDTLDEDAKENAEKEIAHEALKAATNSKGIVLLKKEEYKPN